MPGLILQEFWGLYNTSTITSPHTSIQKYSTLIKINCSSASNIFTATFMYTILRHRSAATELNKTYFNETFADLPFYCMDGYRQ